MFATMERPVKDEVVSTWLDNILTENGADTDMEKAKLLHAESGSYPEKAKTMFQKDRYAPYLESLRNMDQTGMFPDPDTALRRHTDVYALLPLTAREEQVKRSEYCLHGVSDKPGIRIRYLYNQTVKICPQCLKEDMKKYGRKIIHVPHQLYVNACWKHGCILQDDENPSSRDNPLKEEPASQQDVEKAVFMHDLYMNPAIAHFKLTENAVNRELKLRNLSRLEALEQSADAGYTQRNVPPSFFTGKTRVQISSEFYDFYIGMLTWLFHTADKFKSSLHSWDPADEYSRDDFELLEMDGIVGRFQCRSCGHKFYMHPCGAEYGIPCPKCMKKMNNVQIYQRYADYLNDGEYDITNENGKIHVIHKECGTDRSRKFFNIVCNRTVCPVCREKRDREARIDTEVNGFKIIGYNRADDVTVQTKEGRVIRHRNYSYIKNGTAVKTRKDMGKEMAEKQTRKDRIGDTNVNYQGMEMTITDYISRKDITVLFSNGDEVKHRKYEDFCKGRIRCPSYIRDQRIGETNVNGHGEQMTIVDYKNTDDITVQFDSKSVVEHTTYEKFRKGYIRCPSHANHEPEQDDETSQPESRKK